MIYLSGVEIATLTALVEEGPLRDDQYPSGVMRDKLILRGLAARVVVEGRDGYTAATYAGRDVYKDYFGGDSIPEAKANRIAGQANE